MKLSSTDIIKYETCPRQYHLLKCVRKGKKQSFAFYRFSSALHYALKQSASENAEAKLIFTEYWKRYQYESNYLIYKNGETWEYLYKHGIHLLDTFMKLFGEKEIIPILTENKLIAVIEDIELIVQPDLVGECALSPNYIVLDYKTTEEPIVKHWVDVSDQLTAGAMAVMQSFHVNQVDVQICNFVKSNWSIQWLESKRNHDNIEEYRQKVLVIAKHIRNGYFPRRSLNPYDSPCAWCEVQEYCFSKQTEEDFLGLKTIGEEL